MINTGKLITSTTFGYNAKPKNFDDNPLRQRIARPSKSQSQIKSMGYVFGSFSTLGIALIGLKKYAITIAAKRPPAFLALLSPTEKTVIVKMLKEGFSPELAEIFTMIKGNKEKEGFIKQAHQLLLEHMGYKNCIPELKFEQWSEQTAGSWNPTEGNITIYKGEVRTRSKANSLGTLRHELEHFVQDTDIARTEGYKPFDLIDIGWKRLMKTYQEDEELCIKTFGKKYSDFDPKILEYLRLDSRIKDLNRFNINLYTRAKLDKGNIDPNSSHGKRVKEYVDASLNYTHPTHTDDYSRDRETLEKYENNLLEKLANEAADKIQSAYERFIFKLAEAAQKSQAN